MLNEKRLASKPAAPGSRGSRYQGAPGAGCPDLLSRPPRVNSTACPRKERRMRNVPLPQGVKAVWDLSKAHHETTPTRERICINGLWRGQPVDEVGRPVPADNWGYYKVPAPWSATSQTLYPHPAWKGKNRGAGDVAWYQREITIPDAWQGRRIAVCAECLLPEGTRSLLVQGRKGELFRRRVLLLHHLAQLGHDVGMRGGNLLLTRRKCLTRASRSARSPHGACSPRCYGPRR